MFILLVLLLPTSGMATANKSHSQLSESTQTGLVDVHLLNIFIIIFYVVVLGIVSSFGMIFNTINVIVFFKQGFKDTVNITLFGLAVSDILASLTLLWMSICFSPWFMNADLSINQQGFTYITAGWLHLCFARISSWITAWVTFERCLCIALPLKVKTIITPTTTNVVLVGIYLTMIVSVAPVYYSISLGPKFFPERNATKIGLIYTENGLYTENICLSVNAFSQIAAFLAVLVCTLILVQNLLVKSKWRQSTSSYAKQESVTNRDKKVVKMILLISVIFIVCLLPGTLNIIAQFSIDEYTMVGRYQNLYLLTWTVFNSMEAVNSTVNIFVYYNMSSKYKEILREMFNRNKRKSI
ncbi:tachykinin-like peptides receptor 86C [Aplysia californica]|uniref:Tachykinin-like peptides receptor 86C n=1 Tax=Aplysia californica TaxID=6500 RepID=A0ABM0JP06_APLCA|nr:tachykinin-like peptides receptor 86C [Aplysia californica]